MKKVTILSIAIVAMALASCEKERNCHCVVTSDEPGSVQSSYNIEYKDVTKKQAQQACVSLQVKPDGQPYTETRTCTLD